MRRRRLWNERFLQHRFLPVSVLGLAVGVTAGPALADGPWLPPNVSTLGERIDHLWNVIFVITAVLLVLTEAALLWFIFRYRSRPGRKASYQHESRTLETVWSVIPGLILVFLAVYQFGVWADARINIPDSDSAVRVQVYAKQFEWRFRYAGADGRFATDDDVTTTNQLHIPSGKPILAQLRAQDVIHSFFLPNFRVKQDVVPGSTTLIWFDATTTGDFEIACAELCGLGHYRMRALLRVETEEEFETWLQSRADAAVAAEDWGWNWREGL